MRLHTALLTILVLSQAGAQVAWAQEAVSPPKLAFCDPYLEAGDEEDDDGDEEDVSVERTPRYDLEVSEVLVSQEAIMDAIYEEKWDLATGTPVERFELCQGVPTYKVNWAQLVGPGADGKTEVLAKGYFALARDGTFRFDFNKRPYGGTWSVADNQMTLTASWLNEGQPFVTPVERVETPIELNYTDGRTDTYTEEVYRVGPFRLMPVDTTVKGTILNCACPTQ